MYDKKISIFNSGFSKILIIGGSNEIKSTEVINTNGAICSAMPDYPGTNPYWPVGAFINGKIIICDVSGSGQCYTFKQGNAKVITTMLEKREGPGSVVVNGNLCITGGWNQGRLKSTECISSSEGDKPQAGPDLPEAVSGHTIVNVNQSHSLVIGGWTNDAYYSHKTYFYDNLNNDWIPGPSLLQGRHSHAAGMVLDRSINESHIAVVGGWSDQRLDTLEMLYSRTNIWTQGTKK